MAKTTLNDGDVVSSDLMTAIVGTGGNTGIIHDGADIDGHAPKIVLTNAENVTGILPVQNMGGQILAYNVEFSINNGSTYTVSKTVDLVRIGNVITMLFRNGQGFDENMLAAGALFVQPAGGGSWPISIFGSSGNDMRSNFFRCLNGAGGTDFEASAYMTYTDNSAAIEIRTGKGIAFDVGDNVRIFEGTFAQFVLALDAIPA